MPFPRHLLGWYWSQLRSLQLGGQRKKREVFLWMGDCSEEHAHAFGLPLGHLVPVSNTNAEPSAPSASLDNLGFLTSHVPEKSRNTQLVMFGLSLVGCMGFCVSLVNVSSASLLRSLVLFIPFLFLGHPHSIMIYYCSCCGVFLEPQDILPVSAVCSLTFPLPYISFKCICFMCIGVYPSVCKHAVPAGARSEHCCSWGWSYTWL